MRSKPVLFLCLLSLSVIAASPLRSPKHAADISGKPMVRSVVNPLLPPIQPAPKFIVRPPKPYHITLAWDATGTPTNRVYVATNNPPFAWALGDPYDRALETTNLWLTVSNLWPNTGYRFAVVAVSSNGLESNLGGLIYWPRARTNWVTFGVTTTPAQPVWFQTMSITNPAGIGFWRLERLSNAFSLQGAPALNGPWTVISNWPAINPATNFWLRWIYSDNVTGFAKPD